MARSLIPAGTAALRDFSHISQEIPQLIADNCVGCMECVTACPDTAIRGKVAEPEALKKKLADIPDEALRSSLRQQFAVTNKYYKLPEKQGQAGGYFGIFIDPAKCKGCGECVDVCGEHRALRMIRKTEENLFWYGKTFDFYRSLPETPRRFVNEKALVDMMLLDSALLYLGGAGSCMGCGEATALRMMLAATGFVYGPNSV
ncbi:MAG: 4Fe-4S binding protein, partial [Acidobacteria bacterium]|nr:4Fe-4S binding protein [Acidobacteriota bacterium]